MDGVWKVCVCVKKIPPITVFAPHPKILKRERFLIERFDWMGDAISEHPFKECFIKESRKGADNHCVP